MTDAARPPHARLGDRATDATPGTLRTFLALLRFELRRWWRTPSGWIHAAVHVAAVAGIGGVALLAGARAEGAPLDQLELRAVPLVLQLLFAGTGAILAAQGAIVGERQDGTAAWVLAKPVGRVAWLGAKAASLTILFGVVGVALPLAALQAVWATGGWALGPAPLALVAGGMWLVLAFLLAVTLALGTVAASRGMVAGAGLGLLFVMVQAGQRLPRLLPGGLPFELAAFAHDGTPVSWTGPAITVALTAAALALAAWRWRRVDL